MAPATKAAQQERRRHAILYVYEELGSPPEELWDGPGGAVAAIMQWLQLKKGADPRPVRQTLKRYVAGDSLTDYKGSTQKLSLGEALIGADCLERGTGREQAAIIISKTSGARTRAWRSRASPPTPSARASITWAARGRGA